MGDAQFMPINYRKLALDYDKDGQTDLWSLPDAIGSIANYFTHYAPAWRWRRGEPIAVPAVLTQRSEEHTSELHSLMRISYAVFCLKKKKRKRRQQYSAK